MIYIDKKELKKLLPYSEMIDALRQGFKKGGETPLRHSHQVKTKDETVNSLLLMPSWQLGGDLGIKITMVCPDNREHGLDMVQSTYILSDATTGVIKALLNGDELTFRRTSSASALASDYLSNPDAKNMLMMGAGKLAAHLIPAHATVRSFDNIYIWDQFSEQSKAIASSLNETLSANVIAIEDPEPYANICDVISCATPSAHPILKGAWLNDNLRQHIDLVGGYTYDMREADDDVIKATSHIYVDTFDGVLAEAGDILQPLNNGIISRNDIRGDFFDLVKPEFNLSGEIRNTLFKSVGTALEDLIAAQYAYEKYMVRS